MNMGALRWFQNLSLRQILIAIVMILLMTLGARFLADHLEAELSIKKQQFTETLSMVQLKDGVLKSDELMRRYDGMRAGARVTDDWTELLPKMVAARQLILRQVRPLGIERAGKMSYDRLLIQVDGNMTSLVALLYDVALLEKPVYVSQLSCNADNSGSGFISAELTLKRLVIEE